MNKHIKDNKIQEEKQISFSNDNYSDNGVLLTPEEKQAVDNFYKNTVCEVEENAKKETQHYHDNPWIQTYTGKKFYPLNPKLEEIDIVDIAHALSMLCRFTGHCKKFYSVGNHSLLCSHVCDYNDRLHALLHDASEAFLADISRPVKRSGGFDNYIEYENNLQSIIYRKFGLSEIMPVSVKRADDILLATEARDLMVLPPSDWYLKEKPLPFKIEPMPQEDVKNMFLKRYYELTGK